MALFGGNAFASSRNPLSVQSSKKLAGKSVVYINDAVAPTLPTLGAQVAQTVKTPFAAFTNKSVAVSKNADVFINSKTLRFLNKNNLLTAKNTVTSEISGNTLNRKTFSDDWHWSTRFPGFGNAPFTASTRAASSCIASATFSSTAIGMIGFGYFPTFYGYGCYAYTASGGYLSGLGTYNTATNDPLAIEATCQELHMACDGQPLPVELMKFEVE